MTHFESTWQNFADSDKYIADIHTEAQSLYMRNVNTSALSLGPTLLAVLRLLEALLDSRRCGLLVHSRLNHSLKLSQVHCARYIYTKCLPQSLPVGIFLTHWFFFCDICGFCSLCYKTYIRNQVLEPLCGF